MGFLISLDLWYNLIFVCRIQCFIPFCSARQKFFFFLRIQRLIPFSAIFCFCAELSELNHSALFCFWAVSSDLYQIALLDKRFRFSAEPSDLYQSADLDKSFSFPLGFSDLYHSALWDTGAFLFLQDPVTRTILLYQTKLFFSWLFPFVRSFLFSFLHIVLSDYETYVLPLLFVFQRLTN